MNEIQARAILALTFAKLFPQRADQVRILGLAGFEASIFVLDGRSDNIWIGILNKLHNRRAIINLLQAAHRQDEYTEALLLDELLWLTCQIPSIDVRWRVAYDYACPSFWRRRRTITKLEEAISFLWDLQQQNNKTIPLLDFTNHLAAQVGGQPIADTLYEWTKAIAQSHWGISDYQGESSARAKLHTDAQPIDLQLLLTPDDMNINRPLYDYKYQLELFYWNDSGCHPITVDRKWCTVNEISERVREILKLNNSEPDSKMRYWDDNAELSIELFLASEDICSLFTCDHTSNHVHDLDQWELYKLGSIPVKFGETYSITVRLKDRILKPHSWHQKSQWHKRWKTIEVHSLDTSQEHILWIEQSSAFTAQALYAKLANNESVVLVGARFSPSTEAELENVLNALLITGTPGVLLPRRCGKEITSDIDEQLHTNHLSHLPKTIKGIRKQAIADPSAIGNYLTLLWDDPNRIPPTLRPYSNP